MYVCMYVCYVCMYVCYVCMYVYIHATVHEIVEYGKGKDEVMLIR